MAATAVAAAGTFIGGIGRWRSSQRRSRQQREVNGAGAAVSAISASLEGVAADRDEWRRRALDCEDRERRRSEDDQYDR